MTYYKPNNPHRLPLLGHLSFGIKSMPASEPFYNAVLATFGIRQVYRDQAAGPARVCGWGWGGEGDDGDDEPFTLFESAEAAPAGARTHLAFNAPSRAAVDAFYRAALAHGGRDNGKPGVRTEVGENYYACFVFDPDGHRLEAVFQQPVGEGEGGA
ncbi:hypothetical protein MMC12_003443 [Toensbergia leucococca]|nr:hypothetical protein [Toensbergia leucococca]